MLGYGHANAETVQRRHANVDAHDLTVTRAGSLLGGQHMERLDMRAGAGCGAVVRDYLRADPDPDQVGTPARRVVLLADGPEPAAASARSALSELVRGVK